MNFFKKLMELKRLLGYNKVYNNLEKKNIYIGPKNAPECTSGHAKFQNHLGEVPQTPPAGGGDTSSHTDR